ncbi:MAG: thiamine diphosphokinase [Oscillospiraceae bacterium]|nr:thiamine diphosphokinase [Oscillospiraceae bacterium]
MKDGICFIFGAGEYFKQPPEPKPGDFVIAADGGYAYLESNKIPVNLFVGDFDSSDRIPDNTEKITLPQMKNETDTAAAIEAGLERGYRVFHIYGGTGGRLDHTLANIQCIAGLAERKASGFLFAEDTVITAVRNGALSFPAGARGIVSVFAAGGDAIGVNEEGLKYSLKDAVLKNTRPVGVSNEFTGLPAEISVREGTLIVIFPKNVTPL